MNFRDRVKEYLKINEGAGLERYKKHKEELKKEREGERFAGTGKRIPGNALKITAKTEDGKTIKTNKGKLVPSSKGFVHGKLGDVLEHEHYMEAEAYADKTVGEDKALTKEWENAKNKKLREIEKRLKK